MKWTVIPDIHADAERLLSTLKHAGYRQNGESFYNDDGHKALFLGDLIDNGTQNAEVINIVRRMVEDKQAVCLMGNHELNAIMLHTGHRPKSDKNIRQNRTFLDEYPSHSSREEVIGWFTTLPIRAEAPGFRAAHAFWGDDSIIGEQIEHNSGLLFNMLPFDELPYINQASTTLSSEISDILKGPEIVLPGDEYGFYDIYDFWRSKGRFKWWGGQDGYPTWESAMMSIGTSPSFPEGAPAPAFTERGYGAHEKNLFIGHYKMKGDYHQVAPNVICLDYPKIELYSEVKHHDGMFDVISPDDGLIFSSNGLESEPSP